MKKLSMLDRLEEFFRRHPGQWVDGKRLETIAGGYAWRTRVSDLRLMRGMTVENRVRRITRLTTSADVAPHCVPGEQVTFVVSEYRYAPAATMTDEVAP